MNALDAGLLCTLLLIGTVAALLGGMSAARRRQRASFALCLAAAAPDFALLSVLLAVNPGSLITTLMSVSWGALGGAFLAPFLYGLFWRGATVAGMWVSFVIGVGFAGGNAIFAWMSPINAGAVSMALSLVACPLVSLFTPKPDAQRVDFAFSCYDERVMVEERYVLTPVEDD